MQIIVNGTQREVAEGTSTKQLLEDLELQEARVAVEVNREIVPRGALAQHRLQAGDRVEIVRAIGGG